MVKNGGSMVKSIYDKEKWSNDKFMCVKQGCLLTQLTYSWSLYELKSKLVVWANFVEKQKGFNGNKAYEIWISDFCLDKTLWYMLNDWVNPLWVCGVAFFQAQEQDHYLIMVSFEY